MSVMVGMKGKHTFYVPVSCVRFVAFTGSMMVRSVHTPHGGFDEEDDIVELEPVKIVMEEGQGMGAKFLFLIGGDFNIELKLEARGGGGGASGS